MKNRHFFLLWAGIIVTIVLFLNGCGKRLPTTINSGQGYQRTVLVELFTSEECTNCPKADAAAESLAAEMGDALCLVEMHPVNFESMGDSMGLFASDTLVQSYEANISPMGLPFFSCDGIEYKKDIVANDAVATYQVYKQKADLRKLVASSLKLSLSAQLDQNDIVYSLKIDSDASLSQSSNLGLVLVVVEDSVNEYGKVFRYVARSLTPNTKGDQLDIQPASSVSKAGRIARNSGWLPWRLSLIAYVRNNDTREIVQAAKVRIIAAVEPPAAPVLNLPANNAIEQSLSPTLSWLASSGAASYTLHLAADSLFSNLIKYPSGLTATSLTLSGLLNSTTYYWRVNASNNAGTSPWSVWHRFTTTATLKPAQPVLLFPADGDTGISKSPALIWKTVSGANSYELQVATSNSFYPASIFISLSGLADTASCLLGLAPGVTYYWRVNASNVAGTSEWANTGYFTTTTNPAPEPPVLISPVNGITNAALDPSLALAWNSSYGASSYGLQLSPYNDFRYASYNQNGLADTARTVPGLDSLTTYHWRTNATNIFGTSNWSTVWKFTDARGYGFSRVITPDSTAWLSDTIISYSLSDPEPPELGFHFFLTNLSARMNIYAQAPTALNSDSTLFWGFLCTETGCQGPNGTAYATFNDGATQHWTVHFNFNTNPPPEGLHWLILKLWAADNPSHIMSRKLYVEVLP
ncbi:hypothetical protein HZA73_10900 [candidate division TA06 bacterium]|nr:hypothetical protein [candidate division TA06 bacterium]